MNHKNMRSTRPLIALLGGRTTLFVLALLVMIGLIILLFSQVSFIFKPLRVFFSIVILPIVLAGVLYYLLRPILRLLEKWGMSRGWGIATIFLGGTGFLVLLVFLIFPFLKVQTMNLIEEFPTYFKQFIYNIDHYFQTSAIFSSYYNNLDVNIAQFFEGDTLKSLGQVTGNALGSIATGVTSLIGTLTGIILSIATVPFILFYLLKDGEKLPRHVVQLLPPRMRDDAEKMLRDSDRQLSAYIQGQIIVAICIGIMVSIGFYIIGMKYAALLGILAMFTSVVPYIGAMIAITPAAIIALVTSPFMLIKLAVVWTVVQLVDSKFISPQVMGKSLKIHPITIIFVLLTSGALFGVAGVLLGIPGYALLKVVVTHGFDLFKKRYDRIYGESDNLSYAMTTKEVEKETNNH